MYAILYYHNDNYYEWRYTNGCYTLYAIARIIRMLAMNIMVQCETSKRECTYHLLCSHSCAFCECILDE